LKRYKSVEFGVKGLK